jgi:cytochrome c-type biogenesis protein CcmH/NrfG
VKTETIVTAVVFFSVGFLAGFVYQKHQQGSVQPQAAVVSTAPSGSATLGAQGSADIDPSTGLPKGHPPLEVAQIIKNLEQSAQQNPRDSAIPLRLANYLYDKRYYNLAIPWYQKSLNLDPRNVNARTDLGTAYFYAGQPEEALREYRQALKLSPNHEPTMFNMIVVNLEGTHDLRAARKYWNELYRRNPKYPGMEQIKQKLDSARPDSSAASVPQ